jgi:hypothetical protein
VNVDILPAILYVKFNNTGISTMHHINALRLGLTISGLALLAACAAPSQTTLSDGTVALRIDCEGSAGGLNYCFERAGKSCGAAGYSIVDQDGRVLSESDVAESDMGALVRAYAADQNSILIRCGN